MHYADRCQTELLSVAPGRLPKTRIDSRTRIANLYSARRGDPQPRALPARRPARPAHPQLPVRAGRQRREDPLRHVGPRPQPGHRPRRSRCCRSRPTTRTGTAWPWSASRTSSRWVIATFEQLWAESPPLEDALSRQSDAAELDQTRAAILRLMAEGEKDEAISRRLSISVRTCRRQIADYMAQVGATQPVPGRRHRRPRRSSGHQPPP